MLILFDHGTPLGLARELPGHTFTTAKAMGWEQLNNGDLLQAAEQAAFHLLLTTAPQRTMPDDQPIPAEPTLATPEPAQASPSSEASEPLPHEEPPAMLDIHDAHHAASTWRDFFIHIATIVLGLMIAVSLEQAVEYFHHRHERRQLEEDLRAEAEGRIPRNTADWDREGLQRGRAATVSGGFVTFVLPDRQQAQSRPRPEDATWPAAKASGLVAVLPNQEIEGWDRVDNLAQMAGRDNDDLVKAGEDFRAVADRLGVSVAPGATVRVTPEERDELMRALALHYERMRHFMGVIASWQGASDAAVHGASSVDQMQPYIARAQAAMPK
jgi:hypothetical protein